MVRMAKPIIVMAVVGLWLVTGLGIPVAAVSAPKELTYSVSTIAASPTDRFVGAVGASPFLFVGFLNGTVVRMDPQTGSITGSVALPDGNSAAHLAYYNGTLFVGTEFLHGARDSPPYHVYAINPRTMAIAGAVAMVYPYANGLVVPIDRYIWAADGHCSLYKIDPGSMQVKGVVQGAAEDEMVSDGTHYWGECRNVVNAMTPGPNLPTVIASGSLTYPNRPRGFFIFGSGVYTSGTMDYVLYSMSIQGSLVLFTNTGILGNHSIPTRDTTLLGSLLYTYQTGSEADSGRMPASIFVYNHLFRMRAMVPLPGPALPSDASQHTLFVLNSRLYFVTQSAVGSVVPPPTLDAREGGGQSGNSSSTQQSARGLAAEGASFMTSVGFLGPMFRMSHLVRSRPIVAAS
jgi:hypothetical protein